jgi:hypothetical protein
MSARIPWQIKQDRHIKKHALTQQQMNPASHGPLYRTIPYFPNSFVKQISVVAKKVTQLKKSSYKKKTRNLFYST